MRQNEFPEGWDQGKVKQVLAFYEGQTENEAVAEDEARVQSPEAAVLPIRICVVEPLVHPSPGTLARRLPDFGGFAIRAFDTVPDPLDLDALVLNSIASEHGPLPEQRILDFVQQGGGLFCLHDTVYPYGPNHQLLEACGIRAAFDAVQVTSTQEGIAYQVLLARANPDDPMQRFPVRPLAEGAGHPILEGVGEFELAEEVWAQNLASGVRPLLSVDVGDRIPSHQRFREPIPVSACKGIGQGRVAFFSLGHFAATYEDAHFLRLLSNALKWVTKRTNEASYNYDVFLSFSFADRDEARRIRDHADALGLRMFMAEREVQAGDVWDEVIRQALVSSREVAILVTPDSLQSEWVSTEWGAAWALQKRIAPILLRCNFDDLPARLERLHALDFHNFEMYLSEVRSRAGQ